MSDYDLQRFIDAQDPVWGAVQAELKAGAKRSHWMWFVFPQLAGLGLSATAQQYAIRDLAEAKLYVSHEILGPRLKKAALLVLETDGKTAQQIFGYPDDLKLRSSMTLFAEAEPSITVFTSVLDTYFGGTPDEKTLDLLDH